MEEVVVRPATADDYGFLYHLNRAALKEYVARTWGWDEEAQEKRFRDQFDPDRRQIVQLGGEDIGAFGSEDKRDHIFIEYIALLPQYQRRGIGSHFLNSVIEVGSKLAKPLHLQVNNTKPAAEF